MGPHRPNAVDLPEAIGLSLDDVEDPLGEGADKLAGVDRADAPDHSRGQVLFDAFCRGRCGGAQP
jgi:hypothetical protein